MWREDKSGFTYTLGKAEHDTDIMAIFIEVADRRLAIIPLLASSICVSAKVFLSIIGAYPKMPGAMAGWAFRNTKLNVS